MKHTNHYVAMFWIMVVSGLLSTMNVWVDKVEDIRYSINDIYMILLMVGWMYVGMGVYDQEMPILCGGIGIVCVSLWCIRTQFLVTPEQYMVGMIPHHSMAVHMSRQLLQKTPIPQPFVKNILETQEKEIMYMKEMTKV